MSRNTAHTYVTDTHNSVSEIVCERESGGAEGKARQTIHLQSSGRTDTEYLPAIRIKRGAAAVDLNWEGGGGPLSPHRTRRRTDRDGPAFFFFP